LGSRSSQKNNIIKNPIYFWMLASYSTFAVKLFGWIPDKFPETINSVRLILPKSDINVSPRNYISTICLTAVLGYSLGFISILNLFFFDILKLNILTLILVLMFAPLTIGVTIFIIGVFYPHQRAISRNRSISTNLPFAIAHMGAIAASGVPPSAIFKLLSEFKEYDALSEEMKKITRNIEFFGLDPITAIREVAKRTPSEKFRQLLLGIASTIESGGDLKTYLKNAGEQSLFAWRLKREKYLQQLSNYAEFYTGLLIAAPLFIISLFSVMYMIQPQLGSIDILYLMKLSIYLIIPALNLGFLLFLQMTQVEM